MTFKGVQFIAATAAVLAFLSGCTNYGPIEQNISSALPFKVQQDSVGEDSIAYYQVGEGKPEVFMLHGIPTTSYLWRNVAPIVAEAASTVAFDLPGYGESSIPASGDYSHQGLYKPMADWLDQQDGPFVLVVNDLGSILGIDYAMRNPDRVHGLVLVEAVFMPAEEWLDQLTSLQKFMFRVMRSKAIADFMIVSRPRIQALALDLGTIRKYTKEERHKYLGPYFEDKERRRVVRDGPGPAAMPKGGISVVPGDVADVINQNAAALAETDIPILFLTSDPGFIVQPEAIEYAKSTFKNFTVVDVGAGIHFLPEDQPTAIGEAIRDWLNEQKLVFHSDGAS